MDREVARDSISEIYESLSHYKEPADYYPPTTCDGYHFILGPTGVRQPRVAGLYNGLAVLYTSNNFAGQDESITPIFSNRFIFPDSNVSDVRYYRQPLFDRGDPESFRGFEELAEERGVIAELDFVNEALKKSVASGEFEHANPRKLILSRESPVQ